MSYIGNKPANKAVVASDLDPAVITGQTALSSEPASTDEFLISDAGVLKRLDASLIGGGKIGQVVQTHFTTQSQMSSSSFAAITGCTVDITPSATSSKVFVMISLCAGVNQASYGFFKLYRDTTLIGSGSDSSNRIGCNFSISQNDGDNTSDGVKQVNYQYLDSPSSTSALTYGMKFKHGSSSTKTLRINYDNADADDAKRARAISTITLMEISG